MMTADLERGFETLANQLRDVTVAVRMDGQGVGSGIVFRADGAIVTNAHVVHDGDAPTVTFSDGRSVAARIERVDPDRDLALLRTDVGALKPALRRHPGDLRVGEIVVAFGHPLGVANVLSVGIVHAARSASSRRFVQADVRIAPGNSGGPLADIEGRVLGINTMVVDGSLTLAIPMDDVAAFVEGAGAKVRLGIRLAPVRLPDGRAARAIIEVRPGDRAAAAGLIIGDIVLDPSDTLATVEHLDILRGGVPLTIELPTAAPVLRAA